jgi:hypothetical protein
LPLHKDNTEEQRKKRIREDFLCGLGVNARSFDSRGRTGSKGGVRNLPYLPVHFPACERSFHEDNTEEQRK